MKQILTQINPDNTEALEKITLYYLKIDPSQGFNLLNELKNRNPKSLTFLAMTVLISLETKNWKRAKLSLEEMQKQKDSSIESEKQLIENFGIYN